MARTISLMTSDIHHPSVEPIRFLDSQYDVDITFYTDNNSYRPTPLSSTAICSLMSENRPFYYQNELKSL